jgi:unsaturated rhamnogalacturonyl hydrolase
LTAYFDEQESIYNRYGSDDAGILNVIANRYLGANPAESFTFRVFQSSGILQTNEGLYDLDLDVKLPEAQMGQFAYAFALVWSDSKRNLDLTLSCLGPIRFYMNQEMYYRSNVIDEIKPDARVKLNITFEKGWNQMFIRAQKTAAGFGCLLGADEAKVRILNVLSPFLERKGQSGWVYSEPTFEDNTAVINRCNPFAAETASGLTWLPKQKWDDADSSSNVCERLFGTLPGKHVYAWTQLNVEKSNGYPFILEGSSVGTLKVWIDEQLVVELKEAGDFEKELHISTGKHHVSVQTTREDANWGFQLHASQKGVIKRFSAPHLVQGSEEVWFYLGPFEAEVQITPKELCSVDRVFDASLDSNDHTSKRYWQLDAPSAWIRPYYENAMLSNKWTTSGTTNFARWDYPLGVTMYGLLQAGRILSRQDMIHYVVEHIQACTRMYVYSLWDQERYGFPAINQQLVMMKMLDNCGSFGSAMLEAYEECEDEDFLLVAGKIAEFMTQKLDRKTDGAFYRTCIGEYSENTMWADDLYMSTPFLKRYARITGMDSYLEEAINQFKLFKNYLYIPEQQIMSHVYDFKYGVKTGIPWGRGNGWTVFSLSELLESLPEDHPERNFLVTFFKQLCEGYLALQGSNGLWHQVLTHPDAYEEASCTAMFTYAFARGIRLGWLDEQEQYIQAVLKAWKGLTEFSMDHHGNVHGVCSGSRYSFTADYYKEDLLTVTNDNHGIGIMLLAAVEVIKLKQWQLEE